MPVLRSQAAAYVTTSALPAFQVYQSYANMASRRVQDVGNIEI